MTTLFPHTQEDLAAITAELLDHAHRHGATDAQASVFENQAHSVHLRQGRIQALGSEVRNGLSLTVFIGQRQGITHSTDLTPASLAEMANAACAIARHTEEDPFAGLPEQQELCSTPRNLDLFHPWMPDSASLIELAHEVESGLQGQTDAVSDGAWVNAAQNQFWLANSRGFGAGYAQSSHSQAARALAQRNGARNLDFWYSQSRSRENLPPPAETGRRAAQRAVAALGTKPLAGGEYPVLFDPRSAASLLGHFTQAISGRPLYMRTSFLQDNFDTAILPAHIDIIEDPFIPGASASGPFDSDGISGTTRQLVAAGILRGALLGNYSARRLGRRSTGNAGGAYNLTIRSSRTKADDNLDAMLRTLGTGLLVTSLAGEGVRLISGDYSRVAQGFWVEGGTIRHPVEGVTLAGNLRDMWQRIAAIGADTHTEGPFTTGSILVEAIRLAGQ